MEKQGQKHNNGGKLRKKERLKEKKMTERKTMEQRDARRKK